MPALRRTAFAALAAALALTYGPSAGAQTVVVGPRATGVSTSTNGLVTVPVVADLTASGGASLGSLTGRLTWRPAVARYVNATAGNVGPVALNSDTTLGQLQFAVANAAGVTGTPVLVNVTFQALGAPNDTTLLNLSLSEVTAAGTFADLLPITVATSAQFCVAGGRYGDLDGNDSLRSNDALFIVTHAVGLSIPYPTFNGDVDNDGKVDTRDALLVLSYVVGLPTAPYRVGQFNTGGCTVRGAASIAIQPAPPGLVVGDQFPLGVVALDSSGAVTNTQSLAWISLNPAVATVDSTGRVTAVATGTTQVVAIAAPGLADTASVTVTSVRHTWWVDPIVAAGQQVELGSPTQPFATIQPAVNRAAPGDTVWLAVADHGTGARITKPLVVIGDSTAAGLPRVRGVPSGPAFAIDSLASGSVELTRLRLVDANGGVVVSNSASGTLFLDRVIVERSRGTGIVATDLGTLRLFAVEVSGAVGAGIDAQRVLVLDLDSVKVDLVAAAALGVPPFVLRAASVDTVRIRGANLRTGTVSVDGASVFALAGSRVAESPGPLLRVFNVPRVSVDSTGVVRARDTLGTKFFMVDTLTILASQFADGRVLIEHTPGGTATARLDSTTFTDAALAVKGLASLAMRGGHLDRGDTTLLGVDFTPVVHLAGVELSGAAPFASGYGPFAVRVSTADSVRLDSLWFHTNDGGAFEVTGARILTAYGNRVEDNHRAQTGNVFAGLVRSVQRARFAQSVVRDRTNGIRAELAMADAAIIVDSSTFEVTNIPIYALDVALLPAPAAETVMVRGSRFRPYPGTAASSYAAYIQAVSQVRVEGNDADSGVYHFYITQWTDSIDVRNNLLRGARNRALYTSGLNSFGELTGGIAVTGNTVECSPGAIGMLLQSHLRQLVAGNTVTGPCSVHVILLNGGITTPAPATAVATDNVVRADSVYQTVAGIQAQGSFGNVVIARNQFLAGTFHRAMRLATSGTLGIDTARVDSNLVQDGRGSGFLGDGIVRNLSLRGNVVQRMRALFPGASSEGGIALQHNIGGAVLVDNQLRQNEVVGLQLQSTGLTVSFDSTVIVDHARSGIEIGGFTSAAGRRNYVGRNLVGVTGSPSGTITIDTSTFENNVLAASGPATYNLANNWWGSPAGPGTYPLGAWAPAAYLPIAMDFLATGAAFAAGRIFVAGGSPTAGAVYSYHPVTNSWTARPSLPSQRRDAALAAVGDTVFVIGGIPAATGTVVGGVERYDTVANVWTARAAMPTARSRLMTAAVGGIIYAIGGRDSLGSRLGTVEAYDPTSNTWTTRAAMPTPRSGAGIAVLGGLIYVVGGSAATGSTAAVEVYDPVANTWTARAPLPMPNEALVAGAVSGRVYAVGGVAGQLDVRFFDPASNRWYVDASLTNFHSNGAMASFADTLFAIGGNNGSVVDRFVPPVGAGAPPANSVSGALVVSPVLGAPPTGGVIGAPPAGFARAGTGAQATGFVGATRAVAPRAGAPRVRTTSPRSAPRAAPAVRPAASRRAAVLPAMPRLEPQP